MVNKKVVTPTNISTNYEEICATMDDLRYHNQTLEDSVFHFQHQKEDDPLEETKVMYP